MNKLFLIFSFFTFSVLPLCAQQKGKKISRKEYISNYCKMAIEEMRQFKIPASITLAQGALESGNGNSKLARKAHNHFGIKCKASWRGKKIFHHDDKRNECFRKYASVEDSYRDHSKFLRNGPRYARLFDLDITDYEGWAYGLKEAGYATNKNYPALLIKIIEENKLYMYDQPELLAGKQQTDEVTTGLVKEGGNDLVIELDNRREVKRINGLKAIVVEAGDSFEGVAAEMGLKTWEIYHYNDYTEDRQPRINEILYIDPKRGKAQHGNDIYEAGEGDSMHFISQRFGIRLKSLLKKNRMKPGDAPKPGQKIYLRKKKRAEA